MPEKRGIGFFEYKMSAALLFFSRVCYLSSFYAVSMNLGPHCVKSDGIITILSFSRSLTAFIAPFGFKGLFQARDRLSRFLSTLVQSSSTFLSTLHLLLFSTWYSSQGPLTGVCIIIGGGFLSFYLASVSGPFFKVDIGPLVRSVIVVIVLSLLSAHELEVVHLLQLGDDELAPHVGDLHLELLDLHVADLDVVLHVVEVALAQDPPGKRSKVKK